MSSIHKLADVQSKKIKKTLLFGNLPLSYPMQKLGKIAILIVILLLRTM